MRKILILFLVFVFLILLPAYAWKKKPKPVLFVSDSTKNLEQEIINNEHGTDVFKTNSRIYFIVYTPEGFKSDYIKYQLVKQDDNAHIQGYKRIRNVTCKLKNNNYYEDYFVLHEKGKYFLQIFDITNLHQWVAIGGFLVVE